MHLTAMMRRFVLVLSVVIIERVIDNPSEKFVFENPRLFLV